MTGTGSFPLLAEIDPARIAHLEQDLADQSGLILWVYGTIILLGLLVDLGLLLLWRTRAMAWRAKVSRLLWRPWCGRDVLIILLVLSALQAVAGCFSGAMAQFCQRHGYREESVLLLVETLILHVAGFVTVLILLRRNRVSWDSAFGFSLNGLGKRAGQGILCLLATMPPLLFYTWIYHLVLQFSGFDAAPQDVLFAISEETSVAMRIFFVVLAAVLAPFFEEMLFRGILLPFLAQRLRLGVAISIVSVLFALMHWNVASFVPLFVLSVAFCLVYIYTESLLASMVMHSMFNLVTVSLLLSIR